MLRYDEARVVPDPTQSLAGGAVEPWSHPSGRWYQKQLLKAAKKRGVDVSRPYAELSAEDRQWVYDGGAGLTGIRGFASSMLTRALEPTPFMPRVRPLVPMVSTTRTSSSHRPIECPIQLGSSSSAGG